MTSHPYSRIIEDVINTYQMKRTIWDFTARSNAAAGNIVMQQLQLALSSSARGQLLLSRFSKHDHGVVEMFQVAVATQISQGV